ncbi:MAG: CDP-alcohol phosphatidyltransferase family protein [Gemmatales bacterium]
MFYRHLPLALTLSRFVLAPVLVAIASTSLPGWTLALICVIAFLTDLFDGILARRWGVATPQLRRLDVIADVVFYLGMIVAFYLRRPDVIHTYGWYFVGFIVVEVLCQAISL